MNSSSSSSLSEGRTTTSLSYTSSPTSIVTLPYISSSMRTHKSSKIHKVQQADSSEEISKIGTGILMTGSFRSDKDSVSQQLESSASEEDHPLPLLKLKSSLPEQRRGGNLKTSITVTYRSGGNSKKKKTSIEGEGVSPEFIANCNALIGDMTQRKKAERLSKNMRQLAGLEPSQFPIDISDARNGIWQLAGLDDDKLKYLALNNLEASLEKDPRTPETSVNLIIFASNFFNWITRREFKAENPNSHLITRREFKAESLIVQKKIGAIFELLLPLLQYHFTQKNIGPITSEIKSELTMAAIVLGKVNSMRIFETTEYSINVPLARLQLCENAALADSKEKMKDLNSLEYMIKNDPCTSATAPRLVDFAINYLKLINRDEFQKEDLSVQLKMVEIYDALIDLLLRQYANENISAISDNLKTEFVTAAISLEKFNTSGDIPFKYHIRCALQGSRLLMTDREVLLKYLKRSFEVTTGIVSMGVQQVDAGANRISAALKSIDPRLHHTWFDNTFALKTLGREAFENHHQLTEMLSFIKSKLTNPKKKERERRWEFYYAAVNILKEICLAGSDLSIKFKAFKGVVIKADGEEESIGGLATLASLNSLKEYRDMDKVKRLHRPKKRDPNILIRSHIIDSLLEILKMSQDKELKLLAKKLLLKRFVSEHDPETDPDIITKLKSIIPSQESSRKKWLKHADY